MVCTLQGTFKKNLQKFDDFAFSDGVIFTYLDASLWIHSAGITVQSCSPVTEVIQDSCRTMNAIPNYNYFER